MNVETARAEAPDLVRSWIALRDRRNRAVLNGGVPEELRAERFELADEIVRCGEALGVEELTVAPGFAEARAEAGGVLERTVHGRELPPFVDDDGDEADPIHYLGHKLRQKDLEGVVKRGAAGALWDLRFADGSVVPLGSSEAIQSPTKVRAALLDVQRPCPRITPKQFEKVTEALVYAANVEDSGAGEREETVGWLAEFVEDRLHKFDRGDTASIVEALEDGEEVLRDADGRLSVRLDALLRFVTRVVGQRTTRRDLAARLARLGFEPEQLSARDGNRVVKRRVHTSPPGFDLEEYR